MRWSDAEVAIAGRLGRTRDQVVALFARRRRAGHADRRHQTWVRWTPEAEDLATVMYRAGDGPADVSRATGHTVAAVWALMTRLRERSVDLPNQRG